MKSRAPCPALYKLGKKMHEAILGGRRFHHKDKLIDIKSEAEMQRLADLWESQVSYGYIVRSCLK